MLFVDFIKSDIYFSSRMPIYGQFTDSMPALFHIIIQHRGEKKWFTFTIYIFIYKKKRQLQMSTIYPLWRLCLYNFTSSKSYQSEKYRSGNARENDGAAKSGQFRNMSHVGLKSSNDDTQQRLQQWWGTRTPSERDLQLGVFVYTFILKKMPHLLLKLFFLKST